MKNSSLQTFHILRKKGSSIAKGVMEYINEQYDPAMSWKDAEYCIKKWGGPFRY